MNFNDERTYCEWSDMRVRDCAHCRGHVAEGDTQEMDAVGRVAKQLGVPRREIELRIPKYDKPDEEEAA